VLADRAISDAIGGDERAEPERHGIDNDEYTTRFIWLVNLPAIAGSALNSSIVPTRKVHCSDTSGNQIAVAFNLSAFECRSDFGEHSALRIWSKPFVTFSIQFRPARHCASSRRRDP
jgi:hypothetical protein